MRRNFETLREQMVEKQLIRRGVTHPKLLEALRKVPRHLFVPRGLEHRAYEDHPVPIGFDQTISQPYIVALMTQCLAPEPTSKILEIGTGSGYQTAILAELSGSVYTLERIHELLTQAEQRLDALDYANIVFKWENGTRGWEAFCPYDGILMSCASRTVPPSLFAQLGEGGRLVIPLGGPVSQVLTLLWKDQGQVRVKEICGCAFVPLIEKETAPHEAS